MLCCTFRLIKPHTYKFSHQMHLIHRSSILVSCLKFLPDLTGSSQALYIYKNLVRHSHFNICNDFLIQSVPSIISMLGLFSTRASSQSLRRRMPSICFFQNSKPFPSNLLISKRFFTSFEVEAIAPKIYDRFLQKLSRIQIGKGLTELKEKLKSFLLILNLKKNSSKAEEINLSLIPVKGKERRLREHLLREVFSKQDCSRDENRDTDFLCTQPL